MKRRNITILFATLVLLSGVPGIAAADHTDNTTATPAPGDENGDDNSGIAEALSNLIETIEEFTEDWDHTLQEALTAVLFHPFRFLAQQLIEQAAILLTNTPTIHPNSAVEQVHQQVLLVTYLLSGLAFTTAGILHMIGPILGISYSQVRKVLPRVVLALVFGTVSLPLLQYAIDLTDALTQAFAPSQLTITFHQMVGLQSGLVLVYLINSILLLALLAIFVMRAIYIMFGAAISPLLALMWSIPRVKPYADTFIGGWFSALLIAPLDMLAFKFIMALLNPSFTTPLQDLSNWLLGIAGFLLLLFIPYQVWSASQAALGAAYGLGNTIKKQVLKQKRTRPIRFLSPADRRRLVKNRAKAGKDPLTGRRINEDNERGGYRE